MVGNLLICDELRLVIYSSMVGDELRGGGGGGGGGR